MYIPRSYSAMDYRIKLLLKCREHFNHTTHTVIAAAATTEFIAAATDSWSIFRLFIRATQGISMVYHNVERWVERDTAHDRVVVLVVYHSESCNIKWIWIITQAKTERSTVSLPDNTKLFLNQRNIISRKKSFKFRPSKSKTGGLLFGTIWNCINPGSFLEGQSWRKNMFGVKAQTDIIIRPSFIPWINHTLTLFKLLTRSLPTL